MRPKLALPIDSSFRDEKEYIEELLRFATTCRLFQIICGGIHILDFLTQEPDLFSTVLPLDWRQWMEDQDIAVILDLLLREPCNSLKKLASLYERIGGIDSTARWCGRAIPPRSLLDYVLQIRKFALCRDTNPPLRPTPVLPQHVRVGMKPKKIHEVENLSRYLDDLTSYIQSSSSCTDSPTCISHVVDFGSGQNYLGRALASPPYNKHVVALENRPNNISEAKAMDVHAKLVPRRKIHCNKKLMRAAASALKPASISAATALPSRASPSDIPPTVCEASSPAINRDTTPINTNDTKFDTSSRRLESDPTTLLSSYLPPLVDDPVDEQVNSKGKVEYHEFNISSSDLHVISAKLHSPQLLTVSLHSCGNLVHYGLRSLLTNESVRAVAMVGCCYNLCTSRLGPPTYKHASLRTPNVRLNKTSAACDPDGFPMSEAFAGSRPANHVAKESLDQSDTQNAVDGQDTVQVSEDVAGAGGGIHLNITARMMACQAPENWTGADCESFFTRHFYRALLQRIIFDRELVGAVTTSAESSPSIIIGSLRKSCYSSFVGYVRGAGGKLANGAALEVRVAEELRGISDAELTAYEERYWAYRKRLGIIWSLMAFSATVVESLMVVDRWMFLQESATVKECWVEAVFAYGLSPRNLIVVGIKK